MKVRRQARNVNRHTDQGTRLLEESIARDGFISAVTVAADGEAFDGSNRIQVGGDRFADAIEVHTTGDKPVVVVRDDIPSADHPKARRLAVLANQITASDWNPDAALLSELVRDEDVIRAIANEDAKLIALLGQERVVQDPMAEWQGMPEHRSEEIRDTAICCLVRFRTVEDREAFEKFLGWKLHHKNNTYTTWYPKQDFDQLGRGTEFVSES